MTNNKILLVDDHSLIRHGIKSAIIEADSEFEIFEAANLSSARKTLQNQKIDAIVLDISLPDGNGMQMASEIHDKFPDIKIIVLSMYDDYEYISRCFEIGVDGYVLKNEGEEIVTALEAVFENKKYYSSGVKDLVVNQYSKKIFSKVSGEEHVNLTQREKEVIRFVIDGLTSKEIADKLFISTRTVDTHRSNIMQKLKVKNSIALVNKVKELNLLE